MFNTLYCTSRTIARHENGPLAESRRRYLEHLAARGGALHAIRAASGVIYRAAMMMKLDESSPVERKDVQRVAIRWAHRCHQTPGLVAANEFLFQRARCVSVMVRG